MLKYKLNTEEFDSLNEMEQGFYSITSDGYKLDVEGVADKTKLDEFRSSNVDLLKQQEAYKGVDLDKYRALEEQERKLRDKELIDKGEFDTLVAERTQSIHSGYKAQIANLNEQLDTTNNNFTGLQTKHFIEGEASKAFGTHKINPEAYDSVMAMIKTKFSMDNGSVIARDGDTILAGADGNLTVSEFVASQPEIFKIQSNGGKGQGNDGQPVIQNTTAKRDAYAKLMPNSA